MSGAIPPLPKYALMAWCSVKAQGQLYLLYPYRATDPAHPTLRDLITVEIFYKVYELPYIVIARFTD
jgi:hypothetical protein